MPQAIRWVRESEHCERDKIKIIKCDGNSNTILGHQVFGGYLRFVPSVPFASVLVPCRAALHPCSFVYGPHIQTVCRLCPHHCGVVRSCHTHRRPLSPSRGPHTGETLSCTVRVIVPGPQSSALSLSIPLWSALVRSCLLCLHFNENPCHLNQQREQLANHTYVCVCVCVC